MITTNPSLAELIVTADRLDQEGKFDEAAKIDEQIKVLGGKAPLKHLDEETKKSLAAFIFGATDKVNKAMDDVKEFIKRSRYYDIDGEIGELGLSDVVSDLEGIKIDMYDAMDKFYGMISGHKAKEGDMEAFVKDHKPSEMFNHPTEAGSGTNMEIGGAAKVGYDVACEDDVSDGEVEEFWKDLDGKEAK